MLAIGPAVLSALLVLQGPTGLEAGARIDTRVGEVPTVVTGSDATTPAALAEQKQVLISATPLLGARWSGENTELGARAATRILWRPVPLLSSRPLILETLETTLSERASPRGKFQLALRGSYGEEDYTSLAQQFLNQPSLPLARTLLTVSSAGAGSWRESRLTTLTFQVEAMYRRSSDTQAIADLAAPGTTISVPALPTQTLVTTTSGLRRALSRRLRVEALLGLAETDIRGVQTASSSNARVNLLTVQPQVGVIADVSRNQQLQASAGLSYTSALVNPDPSQNWLPWAPLVRAELTSLLWSVRGSAVRSSLSAGTAWYADPVLGVAVRRATVGMGLEGTFGPRWNAAARVDFITDINKPLAPRYVGGLEPDETIVQVDVPISCRWNDQLTIEFGARYAERGPNLAASDFSWRNREVWAFATLITTTRQTATRSPAQPPS